MAMDNKYMNRKLGTKWFTFYTKVRPWLACLGIFSVIFDFIEYPKIYLSNMFLLVYLGGSIAQVVLSVMVAKNSNENYIDFVDFVRGVLIFETINFSYQQGVQAYIRSGFNFVEALVMFIIILLLSYFIWYRLNIKYFEKRIIKIGTSNINFLTQKSQESLEDAQINTTPEVGKIKFCRNCGSKLIEGSMFCSSCGTKLK